MKKKAKPEVINSWYKMRLEDGAGARWCDEGSAAPNSNS